jgi:predicted DNA-binding transcriptional regulator YafY
MAQVARQTGWSRATAYRALDVLEVQLRVPLERDRRRGIKIAERQVGMSEVPGLWFGPAELEALACMEHALSTLEGGLFATVLAPVRGRIESLLQAQQIRPQAWTDRLKMISIGHKRVEPGLLRRVAEAVLRERQLEVVYRKLGEAPGPVRRVSPQTLLRYRDNWFVDVWCHQRRDIRTFAMDRLASAKVLKQKAERVPRRELDRHFTHSYGIYAGAPVAEAVVRFTGLAAEEVSQEEWHPEQRGEKRDGEYVLRVPYAHADELARDILRWGGHAEVVSPSALRRLVARQAFAAAAKYPGVS